MNSGLNVPEIRRRTVAVRTQAAHFRPSAAIIAAQVAVDFETVYRDFHDAIRRHVTRLVGPDEAEDVTQEVFASVSAALPRFRGESSLSTWLYRIATNAAVDRLRSPSFRRRDASSGQETNVPDKAAGAEQTMVRREMNDCIRGYIDRLPASYRAVLVLSDQQGLTNQEIADALGITLHTVKIRLHRARAKLRAAMGDGCSVYRDDRNEVACDPKPTGVSLRKRPPSTRA